MIGRIKGLLLEKRINQLLVDVGGLAYEVEIPLTTYEQVGDAMDVVVLQTHFVVREDVQTLYGFSTEKERDLFRALIKVNGVGPKLALTIQSSIDSESFVRFVRDNEVSALVALPGIGKKTAERLIIDMRDRLPDLSVTMSEMPTGTHNKDALADAESALMGLGYKPQEATIALAGLDEENVEDLIRLALKRLAAGSKG
tara:strand:+ start:79 stop:675 length:597 start_codon:yes stop_codon:yes gene_type:complete